MAAVTKEEKELSDALALSPLDDGDDWINLLIYGDAGAGKTHLIGTASDDPRLSPVVIFDVEGGLKTLKSKEKFPFRESIKRKTVRSMKELTDGYNTLWKAIQTDESGVRYIPGVKTVGVDSLTELTDVDMKQIMEDAFSKNPDKVDKDVPSQREWGKARQHIRTIVRAFRDLPVNVIMTAQVGTLQEEGQPTKYFPGFAGKLRTEVPGFFDIVGYQFSEQEGGNIVRRLQTQGTRRIVAKDRSGALGGMVTNPTLPMLWELINQ